MTSCCGRMLAGGQFKKVERTISIFSTGGISDRQRLEALRQIIGGAAAAGTADMAAPGYTWHHGGARPVRRPHETDHATAVDCLDPETQDVRLAGDCGAGLRRLAPAFIDGAGSPADPLFGARNAFHGPGVFRASALHFRGLLRSPLRQITRSRCCWSPAWFFYAWSQPWLLILLGFSAVLSTVTSYGVEKAQTTLRASAWAIAGVVINLWSWPSSNMTACCSPAWWDRCRRPPGLRHPAGHSPADRHFLLYLSRHQPGDRRLPRARSADKRKARSDASAAFSIMPGGHFST